MNLKTAILFLFISLSSVSKIHAQERMVHQGAFVDIGLGYRELQPQANLALSRMGTNIPASVNVGNTGAGLILANLGYNFAVNSDYVLGLGFNTSTTGSQSQNLTISAMNKSLSIVGNQALYNFGAFLAPGVVFGDGLFYFKLGYQVQVNNSNTGTNYNGYLGGLGYKYLLDKSIYIYSELNYSIYSSQTKSSSATLNGAPLTISITSAPITTRALIGLGYQF